MGNLVFVYGTLLSGFPMNDFLLKHSKFLGEFATSPEYSMYSMGGYYPAITINGNRSILGEVYGINNKTQELLDAYEGYPDYYDKIIIDTEYGPAIVYILDKDTLPSGFEPLPHGDWRLAKRWIDRENDAN